MPPKSRKRGAPASPDGNPTSWRAKALKWVGAATAVISLGLGIAQVTKLAGESRDRQVRVREAIANARQEEKAGDYKTAWRTLIDAGKDAAEGGAVAKVFGHPDQSRRALEQAEEDIAMDWLRRSRLKEDASWRDFADKFVAVLVHGANNSRGARKADLLAHLGWAYFLEQRAGEDLDPATQYEEAVAEDPRNPYAHVFWGHWILWNNGPASEAENHFEVAASARRDLPFIRRIELAGWRNDRSHRDDGYFLRALNEMRKDNEPIDDKTAREAWEAYEIAFSDNDFKKLTDVLPAEEEVALIQSLPSRQILATESAPFIRLILRSWRKQPANANRRCNGCKPCAQISRAIFPTNCRRASMPRFKSFRSRRCTPQRRIEASLGEREKTPRSQASSFFAFIGKWRWTPLASRITSPLFRHAPTTQIA